MLYYLAAQITIKYHALQHCMVGHEMEQRLQLTHCSTATYLSSCIFVDYKNPFDYFVIPAWG